MKEKRKLRKLRKDEVLCPGFKFKAGYQIEKKERNTLSNEWIEDQIISIEINNLTKDNQNEKTKTLQKFN